MILSKLIPFILIVLSTNILLSQTHEQMKKGKWAVRSSIKSIKTSFENKVLIVVGDGAEVLDTMGPYYRLGEDYQVVIAAPKVDSYNLVIHELSVGWDITQERQGYRIESDIAFKDINPDDYVALVLPGGRRLQRHPLGCSNGSGSERSPIDENADSTWGRGGTDPGDTDTS